MKDYESIFCVFLFLFFAFFFFFFHFFFFFSLEQTQTNCVCYPLFLICSEFPHKPCFGISYACITDVVRCREF